MQFKNVKDEFRRMIANRWGVGVIVSWLLFVVFVIWDMVLTFSASRTTVLYVILGALDLLLLLYVASYFLQPILAPKFKVTREFYYLFVGVNAIVLQYIIAMIAAAVSVLVIYWTYFIILIAEICVIITTVMLNQSRISQKLKAVDETVEEDEMAKEEGI
ncbi:MAG: hypothetical protein ACTSYD_06995 [Candidatus Heimdallarchaeaceae archaeon]